MSHIFEYFGLSNHFALHMEHWFDLANPFYTLRWEKKIVMPTSSLKMKTKYAFIHWQYLNVIEGQNLDDKVVRVR